MLHLTGKSVACKEEAGCRVLGDSNRHHGKSDVNEEDSAEEIEESQFSPRHIRRFRRPPVRFYSTVDTVRMSVEDPVKYEGAMTGNENSK